MNSRRLVAIVQWVSTFIALAGIVLVYRIWVHVNPTTVALTLLLFVLLVAARFSLRYAVAVSLAAAACYNFFFLPPVGTFTISDPQNWLAFFAFLATSVIGSRLSEKAREEAEQARVRQGELEVLFALSRELLQTENMAELVSSLPSLIRSAARAQNSIVYLLDGDRVYQSGVDGNPTLDRGRLRELARSLSAPEVLDDGEASIPLRAGAKPRGLLRLTGVQLSTDTLAAIGGLASITLDRAQAVEEVARSKAYKESERLRTLFLDSITHELRTPLTSIKGATGTLLASEHIGEQDRHELLTIVDEEADRLNRLIGEAVEMAQIESQEVRMSFAPVNLREIVEEVQETCSWISATHPVSVALPDLPRVKADRVMVAKVLCNLLENAAKYSELDSPILISAEQRDGYVIASVVDRGVGIDPSEQSLIFEKFYRSRAHHVPKPGTGMGLAICRAIIESHEGTMSVASNLNQGSTFSFSLPVVRP
jgi:two-component system, OmpR family, sensor histidine kinase KdpD